MNFLIVREHKDKRFSKKNKNTPVVFDLICPAFDTKEEAVEAVSEIVVKQKIEITEIKICGLENLLNFFDGVEKLIDLKEVK